jgi:uncharacterized membrane protein
MKRSIGRRAALGAAVAGILAAGFASRAAEEKIPADKLAAQPLVPCYGINSCKGHGACSGMGHACAGQNGCTGRGWVAVPKEACLAIKGGSLAPKKSKKG